MITLKGREAKAMMKTLGIKSGSKFGATGSRCSQGHYHPSKGERGRCDHLHLLQTGLAISMLENYPSIPLWKGRKYKADFRYKQDGRLIVEDFKGAQSRDFQLVKKAWPSYGRGLLRETRQAGHGHFTTVREIEGRWKK